MSKSESSKIRTVKHFSLSEMNDEGTDNYWWVSKRRDGYYLNYTGQEKAAGPHKTICAALNDGGTQHVGGSVEIKSNVRLEELFEILASQAFCPLLHNSDYLSINDAEIDVKSLARVLDWRSKATNSHN